MLGGIRDGYQSCIDEFDNGKKAKHLTHTNKSVEDPSLIFLPKNK